MRAQALDPGELRDTVGAAVAGIHDRLPFTLPLVAKEIRRGDDLAALAAYHNHLLRPLVTLYRVRHAPFRYDFGARYTRDDLAAKLPRAERLLRELLDSLPESRPREPGGGGSW